MVDEGKIALTPAVELSCLTETEQADLLETMESEDCTPSLSQEQQLKALSQRGELTTDASSICFVSPKQIKKKKSAFSEMTSAISFRPIIAPQECNPQLWSF